MPGFTQQEVNTIRKNADSKLRQKAEDVVAPAVEEMVKGYISNDSVAYAIGQMFSWAAMGGVKYVRDLPIAITKSFGAQEDFAYTLCDKVLEEHAELFGEFIENLDAIRLPWKGKVKPEVLQENKKSRNQENTVISTEPKVSGEISHDAETETDESPRLAEPVPDSNPVLARDDTEEDEEELKGFEEKGLRHQDAEDKLNIRVRMVEQLAGVHFKNSDLAERFRHTIRPAIKGVKDTDEVTRRLALVESQGGLGMGQEEVEEVISLIDRLNAKDLELAQRAQLEKPKPPRFIPAVHEHEKMMPAVQEKRTKEQKNKSTGSAKKIEELIERGAAEQPVDIAALSGKGRLEPSRQMHDVISRPLTVGPTEELRTMDLTDFRRLSVKAGDAADKIRKKFDLLREDGIDRYATGIKAWHQSPIYGLYVKIITEGLTEGRPVEDLAASSTNDPERFNKEEFDAIIELNKSLQF